MGDFTKRLQPGDVAISYYSPGRYRWDIWNGTDFLTHEYHSTGRPVDTHYMLFGVEDTAFWRPGKEEKPMKIYSLAELQAMPTITVGHTDDLKAEENDTRVWLSRMTTEDGAGYDNKVTVERWNNDKGMWETIDEYQAK